MQTLQFGCKIVAMSPDEKYHSLLAWQIEELLLQTKLAHSDNVVEYRLKPRKCNGDELDSQRQVNLLLQLEKDKAIRIENERIEPDLSKVDLKFSDLSSTLTSLMAARLHGEVVLDIFINRSHLEQKYIEARAGKLQASAEGGRLVLRPTNYNPDTAQLNLNGVDVTILAQKNRVGKKYAESSEAALMRRLFKDEASMSSGVPYRKFTFPKAKKPTNVPELIRNCRNVINGKVKEETGVERLIKLGAETVYINPDYLKS